jgi:hypothetical protein
MLDFAWRMPSVTFRNSVKTEKCKGGCKLVTLPCTVTPYCDSVDRTRDNVTYQNAVTLRACSVCCHYLAVASKGWYIYSLRRSGRATWRVTTVRSSHLLYIHDASDSCNKPGTPWCNALRILLCHEARDESSDRSSVCVSHWQCYGVTVCSNVTSVYPP